MWNGRGGGHDLPPVESGRARAVSRLNLSRGAAKLARGGVFTLLYVSPPAHFPHAGQKCRVYSLPLH